MNRSLSRPPGALSVLRPGDQRLNAWVLSAMQPLPCGVGGDWRAIREFNVVMAACGTRPAPNSAVQVSTTSSSANYAMDAGFRGQRHQTETNIGAWRLDARSRSPARPDRSSMRTKPIPYFSPRGHGAPALPDPFATPDAKVQTRQSIRLIQPRTYDGCCGVSAGDTRPTLIPDQRRGRQRVLHARSPLPVNR